MFGIPVHVILTMNTNSEHAPQLYERETVQTLGRPLAELMFAHVALHAGDRV